MYIYIPSQKTKVLPNVQPDANVSGHWKSDEDEVL
jgi:hypothetical protein